MNISISTTQLQALVAKSIKGASCNKMIPLTSMMAIERKHNVVTLVTTDANNYLMVSALNSGEDFYAVVPAVLFSQLIMKLTCEKVTLSFEDGQFVVYGNGEYKIALPLDENGDFIKYPEPYVEILGLKGNSKISLDSIKSILRSNKAAVATTLEVPCYTGYYVADRVITTDTYMLCGNNIHVLDTPVLVAQETMQLLDVMSQPEIEVVVQAGKIAFKSEDCVVYGNLMQNIDEYQVDAITDLLDDTFDTACVINRNVLIEALDRVGLFVGEYDNHSIILHFTENALEVSSQQSRGTEVIKYETSDPAEEFTCSINIEMLTAQIKAQSDDTVKIQYGKPNALKILGKNIVQVIALES